MARSLLLKQPCRTFCVRLQLQSVPNPQVLLHHARAPPGPTTPQPAFPMMLKKNSPRNIFGVHKALKLWIRAQLGQAWKEAARAWSVLSMLSAFEIPPLCWHA